MYDRQKNEGKIFTPHELIREIGLKTNDERSVLYWAAKHDIPVFCPGLWRVRDSLGGANTSPERVFDPSVTGREGPSLALWAGERALNTSAVPIMHPTTRFRR